MVSFILQLLIMGSLGIMVYLVAKTIPRIDDTPPKELVFKEHWLIRKIERIDKKIKTSSEKFLRRIGVILLKLENKINKKVSHLKEEAAREATGIAPIEETPREESTVSMEKKEEEKAVAAPTKRPTRKKIHKNSAETGMDLS